MQSISIANNLHKISNPIFWGIFNKYHQFIAAELAQRVEKIKGKKFYPSPTPTKKKRKKRFDRPYKLSLLETIRMTCQSLLSGKNKNIIITFPLMHECCLTII